MRSTPKQIRMIWGLEIFSNHFCLTIEELNLQINLRQKSLDDFYILSRAWSTQHWLALTAHWRKLTLKVQRAEHAQKQLSYVSHNGASCFFIVTHLRTHLYPPSSTHKLGCPICKVPSSPFSSHLTPYDVSAHTIWYERSHHLMWALTSNGVRWLSRRFVKTLVAAKNNLVQNAKQICTWRHRSRRVQTPIL